MRNQLSEGLVNRSLQLQGKMVFLTGDLGFMALEPLQLAMGNNFINAGVAEQNMISVSAAMVREGLETWVYSIAPFIYARPFEQIRNDICFHNLAVKLIGNGGGYGYGVMGPTHHAIEDYGVLLTLPNIRIFIPAFDADIPDMLTIMGDLKYPSYLRLGRSEQSHRYVVPKYASWRQLLTGKLRVTFVAIGPLASLYVEGLLSLTEESRPNFWVLTELPLAGNNLPPALITQLQNGCELWVSEEHVAHGGAGSALLLKLNDLGVVPTKFLHFFAIAHQFDSYGSQSFLRKRSGLAFENIAEALKVRKSINAKN